MMILVIGILKERTNIYIFHQHVNTLCKQNMTWLAHQAKNVQAKYKNPENNCKIIGPLVLRP